MKSFFTLLMFTSTLVVVSSSFLLTSCASPSKQVEEINELEEIEFPAVAERITDANTDFAKEDNLGSVYFLYSRVFIPYEYRKVVRAHAEFLKSNPQLKVILEGNADIGGQKDVHNRIGFMRAEEVKKRLVYHGVDPRRVAIATYGSDRPTVEGKTKEEWQPNRRVDFIYVEEAQLGRGE